MHVTVPVFVSAAIYPMPMLHILQPETSSECHNVRASNQVVDKQP